jgi:predicted membrane protein
MDPERNTEDPDEAYGRALKDRIVRDAGAEADAWLGFAAGDRRVTPRLVIGLTIMAAGLALALDSLGLLDASAVFRFWPLILVAIGLAKLASGADDRHRGLVWIAAGAGFLLVSFGRMSFGGLWALLLFFVGAHIAWRALRAPVPRASDTGESFDMVAVLGGAKTGGTSADSGPDDVRHFTGGRALAVMGGCEIDLRHALIAEGKQAVVDLFVMWGGVEIKVPEDWQVINHGSAFLGGFVNNTRPLPGPPRRLIVTGTAIMGGVEVKN